MRYAARSNGFGHRSPLHGRKGNEVVMIQEIGDALVLSWRNFASAFVLFVPRLVAATIIFVGGLAIALAVRIGVQRSLAWIRFDTWSRKSGTSDLLKSADMPPADVVISKIAFWLVWI